MYGNTVLCLAFIFIGLDFWAGIKEKPALLVCCLHVVAAGLLFGGVVLKLSNH